MSSTSSSFRLPQAFDIPDHIEHKGEMIPVPPQIRQNIRILLNGLEDSNQANKVLTGKLAALQAQVNAIPGAPVIPPPPQTPGGVNDQTNAASYTTRQADYGSVIVVNNGGTGVPVTLNSTVKANFYTKITNNGSTASTLTPDTNFSGAQVISATAPSGAPSYTLNAGQSINLFFNSATKNWYAFA